MMKKRIALLLLLVGSLLSQTSSAASLWNVEVIIFENVNVPLTPGLTWPDHIESPSTAGAVSLASGGRGFRALNGGFILSNSVAALKRSSRYRVLRHMRWQQPGISRHRPVPVVIEGPGLSGTMSITLGKFLHAQTNIVFNDGARNHLNQAKRRMRSNELHYIDHPKVGVLVKVTRAG